MAQNFVREVGGGMNPHPSRFLPPWVVPTGSLPLVPALPLGPSAVPAVIVYRRPPPPAVRGRAGACRHWQEVTGPGRDSPTPPPPPARQLARQPAGRLNDRLPAQWSCFNHCQQAWPQPAGFSLFERA